MLSTFLIPPTPANLYFYAYRPLFIHFFTSNLLLMMPKIHTNWLGYMTSAVLFAASLTSCNRAEYAMLPKTSSYHGTAATRAVAVAPVAPEVAPATIEAAPVATPAPAVEDSTPQVASAVAVKPAAAPAEVATASVPAATEAIAKPAKAPKVNFMQKAIVQKVMKKADKMANKLQIQQKHETADANRLSGNLRTGIILLLVGLLISLIPGGLFDLVGGIIAIVGIVFIVLGLLDAL